MVSGPEPDPGGPAESAGASAGNGHRAAQHAALHVHGAGEGRHSAQTDLPAASWNLAPGQFLPDSDCPPRISGVHVRTDAHSGPPGRGGRHTRSAAPHASAAGGDRQPGANVHWNGGGSLDQRHSDRGIQSCALGGDGSSEGSLALLSAALCRDSLTDSAHHWTLRGNARMETQPDPAPGGHPQQRGTVPEETAPGVPIAEPAVRGGGGNLRQRRCGRSVGICVWRPSQ